MAVLKICVYPDPVLRRKTTPVDGVGPELLQLIDDMAETMVKAPGIGLAANQVGKSIRVLVIDTKESGSKGPLALINPELLGGSGEVVFEEGCLSVPEFFSNVKRFSEVSVRALDRGGKQVEINADGLLAIVLQHEIDHLDGKLFIDRISPVARDIFKRKWKKRQQEAKS